MKTTTMILAAIFSLSLNGLFAGNDGSTINKELNTPVYNLLAPTTPSEASFEDLSESTIFFLVPVAPVEADFSDSAPETIVDFSTLAPVTPSEASFSSEDSHYPGAIGLAPVTPAFADFPETI